MQFSMTMADRIQKRLGSQPTPTEPRFPAGGGCSKHRRKRARSQAYRYAVVGARKDRNVERHTRGRFKSVAELQAHTSQVRATKKEAN